MKRPEVAIQSPPSTPSAAPKPPPPGLHFPSIPDSEEAKSFDRKDAPILRLLHQRYHYLKGEPTTLRLQCFAVSVAQAIEIRILDSFFDADAARSLVRGISQPVTVRQFRVLTKQRQDAAAVEAIVSDALSRANHGHGLAPTVLVKAFAKTEYADRLHDRFAVLDDEVWHFGATVGGSHPALNACSRGWSDKDVGFSVLFDQIWDSC